MISVIICSVKPELLTRIRKNISETIGVPYEIIGVDNSRTAKGICQVYNEAAAFAKYPILCFVHEDVLFEKHGWGQAVSDHFKDSDTGLIGVAGGDAKSLVPVSWSIPMRSTAVNIVQHYQSPENSSEHILVKPADAGGRVRVALLDGVFLCTTQTVFQQFRFNELLLSGFHGYDIDYSLQVAQKFKLYVVYDILLHHYSEGKQNREWLKNAELVTAKWAPRLPVSVYGDVTEKEWNFYHWRCLQVYLKKLQQLEFSRKEIAAAVFRYSFTRYFRVRRFMSVSKYLVQLLWRR
jgi:hypothetical protein